MIKIAELYLKLNVVKIAKHVQVGDGFTVQAAIQSQMPAAQMPCSPPVAGNGHVPASARSGMPMGPAMCAPVAGQIMAPAGYGTPMPSVAGGYGNQVSAGGSQMVLASGQSASSVDNQQIAVGQTMASHQGVGAATTQPQSAAAAVGFMHGGPTVASQMNSNGSSMMTSSLTSVVSGVSSSLPASSAAGVSQCTVSSTVSNQLPASPFISTVPTQLAPSSNTAMQVSASATSIPTQIGGYAGMQQMQPPGSSSMVPLVSNDMNGMQGMLSTSGSMGSGAGVVQGGTGPAQASAGPVMGPSGMNMAQTPMMGGMVSQMQNNMVAGGTVSSGSVGGQASLGSMPTGRPGNQFMGAPSNNSQMSSSLPSSVAASGQMVGQHVGATAARMPNPSNIGPSAGQLQMSGSMQYGYGSAMAAGQPQHQSSAMNNMYAWNSGAPNMMSQGTSILYQSNTCTGNCI